MKASLVFASVAILHVCSFANDPNTISLKVKKEKLQNVLTLIEHQSNYRFLISNNPLIKNKEVTIEVEKASLAMVMDLLLKKTGFTYKLNVGNSISLLSYSALNSGKIEFKEITGTVTNDKGQPLANVSVTVQGTNLGTMTDNNGRFTIDAKSNDVLEFSIVGYKTITSKVGQNASLNIIMQSAVSSLEDVVVVAYGTQKKVDLTGAIATVGADKLDSRPIVNLGDGLVGLVPNLNVNLGNGQPGTAASFNIRGYTTIGANSSSSPLVLVDGVQRNINLLDPNEVESITVLKDAASAAIYGGRAAYGVILITTKTGKKGKVQINYSGSYTSSYPTKLPKYANSVDYMKIFNEAQRNGALTGGYTSSDPFTVTDSTMAAAYFKDTNNNPLAYPDPGNPKKYRYVGNTDWTKVLYPSWAPLQEHYISISGGEGKTSFAASMGYFRQTGLEKVANQIYNRYSPSLKIKTEVNSWLTTSLDISMTHTDNNKPAITRVGQGGSWMPGDLRPIMPVYNPDGHFAGQGSFTNPVAVMTLSGRDIDYSNDFWTTGRVIIKPFKHFNITSDFTWNSFVDFDKANLIPYKEYGVDGVFLNIFPWTNPSQVSESRQNNNYTAFNAYATYDNVFNSVHFFKGMVGFNQEYQHYQLSNSLARNLIDPTLPAIGINNDSKPTVGGTETESALVGTFFRFNYNYANKYYVEVNGRYDGTSRFQADHRYAFSPSISLGWNLAKESFFKSFGNIFRELKLRASYGELPNQLTPPGVISSIAQYPYIATMSNSTVNYLFSGQPGVTVLAPPLVSNNFTWEKVQTKNFGLDFVVLRNRLSGSFDYFITNTLNMVVTSQQLPAVLGTTAPPTNSANLQTKGWEASISWKDYIDSKKFSYGITFGLSDNSSTISKYGGNPTNSLSDYYPGQKLGNIWGYTTLGFYQSDAEAAAVNNSALAGYKWLAGDMKYADLNNDGKINNGTNTVSNPGDMKIIGNNTPRYRFGLNLNASYKNFDFAVFFQGVLKCNFNPARILVFNAFPNDEWSVPSVQGLDYWTPTNTNAYFARARFNGKGNEQNQTKFIQNAAFARMKQITLGYTIPDQVLKRVKLQRVRIYFTGANLLTKTSLPSSFDPEIINYNGNYNTYPINKSVSFGAQIGL